jgi:hypothetical protein
MASPNDADEDTVDDADDVRDALARAMASAVGIVISTAAGAPLGRGGDCAGAAATFTALRFCVDVDTPPSLSRFCVDGARNSAGRQHERVAYITLKIHTRRERVRRGRARGAAVCAARVAPLTRSSMKQMCVVFTARMD